MEIVLTKKAIEDLNYWKKVANIKIQKKITMLLEVILVTPFEGIGKPEALRNDLAGYWSRRITKEHRLVYSVTSKRITVISMRFHY